MNIVLKNAHLISPEDDLDFIGDMLIEEGVIKEIRKSIKHSKSTESIDLTGKTVVPGLYDMHVHFREPGQTHKEDLNTGAEAAANGGFTGVLCMPNTSPAIDNAVLLRDLVAKSKDDLVDINFSVCATKNRKGEELSPILSLKDAGAVAITDDGSPISDPEILRRVFEYGSQTGLPVIQHCEDMRLSNKGVMNEGFISTVTGMRGIPSASETSVIARDIEICSFVNGAHYHIQHISCGGSVRLLRNAKARGVSVTGEACPHHFILTDKHCLDYDTNYKMNPPLRGLEDVEEILKGLSDGTIDVICTDHAPHSEYEKSQGFYDAPFGIIGLETAFGLAYTYLVRRDIISFKELLMKMSVNPRKILRLDSVRVEPGAIANLSVFDLNSKWTVKKSKSKSKSRNTPFDGFRLHGKPFMVLNKDRKFFSEL